MAIADQFRKQAEDFYESNYRLDKVSMLAAFHAYMLEQVPSQAAGPVCPKCGNFATIWVHIREQESFPIQLGCASCEEKWIIKRFADFAQFFRAAPALRTLNALAALMVEHCAAPAEPRRWRDRAFEVLSAINMSVKWELAPDIKKEIAELVAAKERS